MRLLKGRALYVCASLLALALLYGCGSSSSNNTIPSNATIFYAHGAIFRNDTTLMTSGYNGFGQLGLNQGNLSDQASFQVVPGLGGKVQGFAIGGVHTVAFGNVSSIAYAWGSNYHGQLGKPGAATSGSGAYSPAPVRVAFANTSSLTGVKQVAAGGLHSLALVGNPGYVVGWGYNGYGQLGDQSYTDRDGAVKVRQLGAVPTNIIKIAAGGGHSLALTNITGQVFAWGYNASGQAGQDPSVAATVNVLEPLTVQDATHTAIGQITDIAAGGSCSIALQDLPVQKLYFWGNFIPDPTSTAFNYLAAPLVLPGAVTAANRITQIAAGQDHILILLTDGTVWSYGYNGFGQLGDGTKVNRSSFVQVGVASDLLTLGLKVDRIFAVGDYSLARLSNGKWYGWGNNFHGQLGLSPSFTSVGYLMVPTPVTGQGL